MLKEEEEVVLLLVSLRYEKNKDEKGHWESYEGSTKGQREERAGT